MALIQGNMEQGGSDCWLFHHGQVIWAFLLLLWPWRERYCTRPATNGPGCLYIWNQHSAFPSCPNLLSTLLREGNLERLSLVWFWELPLLVDQTSGFHCKICKMATDFISFDFYLSLKEEKRSLNMTGKETYVDDIWETVSRSLRCIKVFHKIGHTWDS